MTLAQKLFSFEGRLRRRDWWLLSIGLGLLSFLASDALRHVVIGPQASVVGAGFSGLVASALDPRTAWIGLAVSVPFSWPAFAMAAKRAHDRGNSARLILIILGAVWAWNVITIIAPLRFGTEGGWGSVIYFAATAASFGASVAYLVICGILDGTPGPNRFGPSPKRIEASA